MQTMADSRDDWAAAKKRFPVGTAVTGVVIDRHPFGLFVDIGAPRSALLLVTRFARTGKPILADGFLGYPSIGDSITACVRALSEEQRVIALTQLDSGD